MTAHHLFLAVAISWIAAKIITIISNYAKVRRFNIGLFVMDGGLASAHSSVVTSLAIGIAFETGFSSLFVFALFFALVVMSDAMHVRRYVGEHAKIINTLVKKQNLKYPLQQERSGHSVWQVLCGFAVGLTATLIFFFIAI